MKILFICLPVVMILCFMVGSQDKAAMAEFEKFRVQAAWERNIKDTIGSTTHEREFQGIPATGKKIAIGAVLIYCY